MPTNMFYFTTIKIIYWAVNNSLFYFSTIKMKSLSMVSTLLHFTTVKNKSVTTPIHYFPSLILK